jgi:hypothetical protein
LLESTRQSLVGRIVPKENRHRLVTRAFHSIDAVISAREPQNRLVVLLQSRLATAQIPLDGQCRGRVDESYRKHRRTFAQRCDSEKGVLPVAAPPFTERQRLLVLAKVSKMNAGDNVRAAKQSAMDH